MYKKILTKLDLTPSQSEILEYLYKNKEAKASVIAKKINRSRAIVYKELDELFELGIVKKIDKPNQISIFQAEHPSQLSKLIEQKEKRHQKEKKEIENILPEIISDFNINHNKPGIKFYEGVDGMKKIYDEILKEGKDFYLIRSAYEPVYKERIVPIIEDFIKKRVKKNIKVVAITPKDIDNKITQNDEKLLFTRFWVNKDSYNSPVEIDIFGNKIAILSFGTELIGLIIESNQIAVALKQIFKLIAK